jgi:hypothetical protein
MVSLKCDNSFTVVCQVTTTLIYSSIIETDGSNPEGITNARSPFFFGTHARKTLKYGPECFPLYAREQQLHYGQKGFSE